MIINKIYGHWDDFNVDDYDIEYVRIPYDYLNKNLFRVTSDKGNEYGISIEHHDHPLHHHDILYGDAQRLVVLEVLPQTMILIQPKTMDEMGVIAHLLGNMHKPIAVHDGRIMLEVDPVVEQMLTKKHIDYHKEEVVLDEPLRYANLGHHHE